jgi:hypothetical protein
MTLSLPTITSPTLPTFISSEFTVSDGVDIVAGGYPLPRTWATEEEAAEVMLGLCWSPRRFAGPFRVIPVTVHRTKHGTVLSVET